MIEITNWSKTFETWETRKLKNLTWFRVPSDISSRGLRALRRMDGGIEAYGVFMMLCQVAAGLSDRGTFINSDGSPMSLDDLEDLTRIDRKTLDRALALLGQIGWVSPLSGGISCQSPDDPLEPYGIEERRGEEIRGDKKRGEERGTREESRTPPPPSICLDDYPDELPEEEPEGKRTIPELLKFLERVNPDWSPHMTQAEREDLRMNLDFWQDLTLEQWQLLKWWYSRKRPALVQKSKTKVWPPADRGYLLREPTRSLDEIRDKWQAEGKPRLTPKKKPKPPKEEKPEEPEIDPLTQLSREEYDRLAEQVRLGPLSDFDQKALGSDVPEVADAHLKNLMREAMA